MRAFAMLRYEDAEKAIAWLEKAFGFEKHAVVPGGPGVVVHGEMRVGEDFIYVASLTPDRRAGGLRTPRELGALTGGVYVQVQDVEAHFARARAAGAEIVQPLEDAPFGKSYVAKDLEGFLWGFGTYGPESRS